MVKIGRSGNFWYLLCGLLFVLLSLPFLSQLHGIGRHSVMMIFNLSMLISFWSMAASRRLFVSGIILVSAIFLTASVDYFSDHFIFEPLRFALVMIFYILSAWIAARSIFVLHKTDLNSLVGAFCIYLLLGLIWAVIYQLLHIFGLATFSNQLASEGKPVFPALVYFSYVTLAGLGYGDIAPVSSIVRTFAYLEVVTGQFYLAILVASLINNFSARRNRDNANSATST